MILPENNGFQSLNFALCCSTDKVSTNAGDCEVSLASLLLQTQERLIIFAGSLL